MSQPQVHGTRANVFCINNTYPKSDNKVMLNGSVMVTETDIAAYNGVIHVIDAVLVPPAS